MKNKKTFQQLGEKLQEFRSRGHESITDVANAIEIDRSHLSKLENGHERPSLDVLHRLISHYSLSRVEAIELSTYAGYEGRDLVVTEKGRKEVVKMTDQNAPTEQKADQIEVNVPNNVAALYSDSVFVTSNQFGIVLDFAQRVGPTNRQNVVSRIGMSKEHARMMLNVLKKHLGGNASQSNGVKK